MARLPKGIFGPFSGKIGPVVGATWNGIPYIRTKAKKKKKKKKVVKSPLRLANEAKFKFANHWMVPFHPYVIVGFGNFPKEKPPISMAFSINYRDAVTGTYPDFEIDYSKVVLSIGNLPGLTRPVIVFTKPEMLELSWEQDSNPLSAYDDQVTLVLYSRDLALTDGFIGGVKRASRKCSYEFDARLVGKELDVYVSVSSLDRKKMASSVYLGRIAP
jgi:hypothetical protein